MAGRSLDREVKLEAVRLVEDRRVRVARAAPDLDIHDNVLHRCVRQCREYPVHAFSGAGQMEPKHAEITQLKAIEHCTTKNWSGISAAPVGVVQ